MCQGDLDGHVVKFLNLRCCSSSQAHSTISICKELLFDRVHVSALGTFLMSVVYVDSSPGRIENKNILIKI